MNSPFRKLMAALLSAAMLVSLVPATAMAYEDEPAPETSAAQPAEDTPDAAPADVAAEPAAEAPAPAEDTPDAGPDEGGQAALAYTPVGGTITGTELKWDYDAEYGRLTIFGTGEMPNYSKAASYPWYAYRQSITEVRLEAGVDTIGDYAFKGYSHLELLRCNCSLSKIGTSAFEGDSALEHVYLSALYGLGVNAFSGTGIAHVYYGSTKAIWDANKEANFLEGNGPLVNCTDMNYEYPVVTSGTCGDNINWYVLWGYALYIEGKGDILNYGYGNYYPWGGLSKIVTDIYIGDGVTGISAGAFEYFKELERVVLPEGLKTIGERAFYYSGLDEINLPHSLESIAGAAFASTDLDDGYVSYAGSQSEWAAVQVGSNNSPLVNCKNFRYGNLGACGDNLTWSVSGTTLVISGTGDMWDFGIGSPVPWAAYRDQIDYVDLPEGLTSIGAWAFENMPLGWVNIPEGVTKIGDNAFYQDESPAATFPSVSLPDSLTEIGSEAFAHCSEMTSIEMGTNVTRIGGNAFYMSGLDGGDLYYRGDNAQFDKIVKGDKMYDDIDDETSWYLWDDDNGWAYKKVHYIYSGNCGYTDGYSTETGNLKWELDWNGCLTITGSGRMFGWGTNGALVYTPWARYPYYNIKTEKKEYLNLRDLITSVSLPEGLENIGASAFNGLSKVTTFNIPKSVTEVGQYAFAECNGLTSLDLRYVVTLGSTTGLAVNSDVFQYSKNLKNLYLGSCLSEIVGKNNFWSCSSDLTIYYQGTQAMWDNVAKNDSTIPANIKYEGVPGGSCGDNVYWILKVDEDDSDFGALYIWGNGAMDDNISPWDSYDIPYQNIYVGEGITHIGAAAFETGNNYDEISYPTSVSLPSTLESIGAYAFRLCDDLAEITIPGSVTSIGDYAFASTGIERVVFYGTETAWNAVSRGTNAFVNFDGDTIENGGIDLIFALSGTCGDNLTWVAVPTGNVTYDGEPKYTLTVSGTGDMDDYAFDRTEWEWITAPPWSGLAIENIVLEEGVTSVGHYAFHGAYYAQSISLPSTLTKVGTYAFYECHRVNSIVLPSSVQDIRDRAFFEFGQPFTVYYDGTKEQWEATSFVGLQPFADQDWMPATMTFLPEITQPSARSINVGDKVSFTVGVEEGYAVTYQWQMSTNGGKTWANSTATGAKTDTVGTTATAARDGYLYRCKITLPDGRVICTEPAKLTVLQLAITAQPQSVNTTAGKTAKFTVTATGSDLTYQWQLSTNGGKTWANSTATGAKTATISTTATAARDNYQYRCVVTSGDKSVTSEPATLRVLAVKTQPANVTAAVGDTAKFTVAASGAVKTYQWQYKTATGTTWASTSFTGNKTATLSVPVTAGRDGYSYRCKITDAAGNTVISNAAVLTVQSGPTITAQPESVNTTAGKTAKFTVTATGTGLTYQWQLSTNGGKTWANSTATGAKTATLSTSAIAGRDGYQYRCVITSGDKSVTSVAATLRVLGVKTQPASVTAAVGDTAKFTVAATGAGLTYQWQYKSATGTTWASTALTGNKTATLSVPVTAGRDGFSYRCKITDTAGSIVYSNAAVLTVQQLAITAQPESVSTVAGNTAKFTVTASGSDLTYQWQYSADGKTWANTTLTGAKTATLSVKASAGRDGYQYRCVITSGDKSVTSVGATLRVLGVKTQPASVTAAVNDNAVFTVTATGEGLTYQWQYSADGITWANTSLAGNKTATLTVKATTGRNNFSYRCVITDAAGNTVTSAAAVLTVK